jgi:hypothetical protein
MSVRGKKTRNPGWQRNNHWVACEVCDHVIRSNDARLTWDGLTVCPDDWEVRHPQDFVRGIPDDTSPVGLQNSESPDTFRTVSFATVTEIPDGTFDNSL